MNTDKEKLTARLAETHHALQDLLEGVDLELLVYPDSGWRIRDILGHIATWDWEIVKSLQAFLVGNEYIISGIEEDESEFNENGVIEQQALSTKQIVSDWNESREDLLALINEIPAVRFPGDLVYPWGDERGSISRLVEYFIEHDEQHYAELEKVLEGA